MSSIIEDWGFWSLGIWYPHQLSTPRSHQFCQKKSSRHKGISENKEKEWLNPTQKIKRKSKKKLFTIPRYKCQQTISCGKGSFSTPIALNNPRHPIASHNSGKLVQFCQFWIAWYSSAGDIQHTPNIKIQQIHSFMYSIYYMKKW